MYSGITNEAGHLHRNPARAVLKLIGFKVLALLFLLIIWQIEEQEFDWATAQTFSENLTMTGWHIARLYDWPPISDIASFIVAALAYVEARISTGRIIALLGKRRR